MEDLCVFFPEKHVMGAILGLNRLHNSVGVKLVYTVYSGILLDYTFV